MSLTPDLLLLANFQQLIAQLTQCIVTLQAEIDALSTAHTGKMTVLEQQMAALHHQLDNLIRHQFGQRSEKDSRLDKGIEDGDVGNGEGDDDLLPAELEFENISYQRRKRRGRHERLPDSLPRVPIYYDLPPEQQICPCGCGKSLRRMGEKTSEELVTIPEVIYVRQHVRPVYGGCLYDSHIVVAPRLPALIQKGLVTPEILSTIAVNKYQDHLPLYRQEQRFLRHGTELSRQTQYNWLKLGFAYCEPLIALIIADTLKNPILHTDDTPVDVLAPGNKKTKTGRLWVYAGRGGDLKTEFAYIFYDYTPNRQGHWAQTRLKGYEGYIHADAYPGYDPLFKPDEPIDKAMTDDEKTSVGKALEIACWMHARRPFYNIAKNNKKRGLAYEMVQMIKALYKIESEIKELPPTDKLTRRQKDAVPLLKTIKAWLDEKEKIVMPKTPMSEAINYALNQWKALCRYTTDGRLSIDNGYAERLIKPTCIGKKNYLFMGSDEGGKVAAGYYTLIQSALLYKLNTEEYLTDIFRRLPGKLYHRLEDLLPHRWKPYNPYEIEGKSPETPIIVDKILEAFAQPPPDG